MAITDFNRIKKLDVESVSGTPTISRTVCLKLTSGDDSTTGTGEIVLDWANISSEADIGVYDENDNLLDYYFESFDATNEKAVIWVHRDWVRDGSTQAQIAYGNGSSDQSVSASTVFDKESDLEAGYLFNESSGDLLDVTSNNNDGTVYGATQGEDGVVGGAYSFDGSDDYIEAHSVTDYLTALNSDSSQSFSINIWVYINSGADEAMIAGFGSENTDEFVTFGIRNGHWDFYSDGRTSRGGQVSPTEEEWIQVRMEWDGTYLRIFENNNQVYEINPDGNEAWLLDLDKFVFGANPIRDLSYQDNWDGGQDNAGIYNAILSDDEYDALYDATKSSPDFFSQQAGVANGVANVAWFDSNWETRFKIKSDNTLVSNSNDNLVLSSKVHGSIPSGFWSKVKSDGGDIRVTKADGSTEVAREVAHIDTTAEELELHFDSSGLSTSSDTEWYVYYNNSGASEPAADAANGSEAVWSNYVGVFHLGRTTGDVIDSSGTKNATANANVTRGVEGVLGKAADFNGSDSEIERPYNTFNDTGSLTLSCWANFPEKSQDRNACCVGLYGNKHQTDSSTWNSALFFGYDNKFEFLHRSDSDIGYRPKTTNAVNTATNILFHGVRDASGDGKAIIYADGSENDTIDLGGDTTTKYSTPRVQIGFRLDNINHIDGMVDEVRIRLEALSPNFITTEYENQSNSSFWTVGSEETGGGVTVTVSTQTLTLSLISPTVLGGAQSQPYLLKTTVVIRTSPTLITGAKFTAPTQEATFSVISPSIQADDVVVVADIQELTFSAVSPTVKLGSVIRPSSVLATFSVISPAVKFGITTEATTQEATFNLISPEVKFGITVEVSVIPATFSVITPTVREQTKVSVQALTASFSVVEPSIIQSAILSVPTQILTFSIVTPDSIGSLWTKVERPDDGTEWTKVAEPDDGSEWTKVAEPDDGSEWTKVARSR